jgi:hypothetical protein
MIFPQTLENSTVVLEIVTEVDGDQIMSLGMPEIH